MSHGIAEVVIPPTKNVEESISQIMASANHEKWHDHWTIGGGYFGHKILSTIDEKALRNFQQELINRKFTVSILSAGKQRLMPESQESAADALWQEWFPGKGSQCLLFTHAKTAGGHTEDICRVSEIPGNLQCDYLLLAHPPSRKSNPQACRVSRMLATKLWNGVSSQKTAFNGNVKLGLSKLVEDFAEYLGQPNFGDKIKSWLVVTVDYHH